MDRWMDGWMDGWVGGDPSTLSVSGPDGSRFLIRKGCFVLTCASAPLPQAGSGQTKLNASGQLDLPISLFSVPFESAW